MCCQVKESRGGEDPGLSGPVSCQDPLLRVSRWTPHNTLYSIEIILSTLTHPLEPGLR